jgi:hypothetical protein
MLLSKATMERRAALHGSAATLRGIYRDTAFPSPRAAAISSLN